MLERRRRLALFGPAFVAAIAYVDPGNFATNFSAGAEYGYLLLWVIVLANVMAMFVQSLSAKLGLATGMSLPQHCRKQYPRPVVLGLWVQAELVAMATDLAEIIGGAIALNLLFGLDLFIGGLITGGVGVPAARRPGPGRPALHPRGDRLLRLDRVRVPAAGAECGDRRVERGRRTGAPPRRRGQPRAGRWDPRRHGHAARDLPALGAGDRDHRGPARLRRSGRRCGRSGSMSRRRWAWPGW